MSNGTEIVYNKEKISHGVEELKQCQKELYEADVLFYKGIMALAAAKGIDLIINEDAAINLYMPEKIVIECREEIGRLLDEITTKVALVETLNDEPKEGSSEKIQLKQVDDEVIEKSEGSVTNEMQALYAPPRSNSGGGSSTNIGIGSGGTTGENQAIYAPPRANSGGGSSTNIGIGSGGTTGENQALYAPPGINGGTGSSGTINEGQALYAPPSYRPEVPSTQPLYGVLTPAEPIEIPIEGPVVTPNIQPMYGVITPTKPIEIPVERPVVTPNIQPMYGVITPTVPIETPVEAPTPTPIIQTMYGVITPDVELPNPQLEIVKEYEQIPNTGIPGVIEQNYVSKHPKLIGGLAATMGLFGIPTILSDDFDEEEEKRINES